MKKSEMARFAGKGETRNEIRGKLLRHGVTNFYQEIEMDSEMVDAQRDTSIPAFPVSQHSHRFWEMICCVRGNPGYLLDTRRYQIRAGDIIIVPPGVPHMPVFSEQMPSPYVRDVVWVSAAMIAYMKNGYPEFRCTDRPMVLTTTGTGWEYLPRYFARNVREAESMKPGWEICIYGNTIQLLVHLARAVLEADGCAATDRREDLLEKVLEYIRENLSGRITLADTARQFHISESTLTHLFSHEMGMGFYRCVTQRRLAEAKSRIAGGLSMEETGRSVGFAEYSAFYRAFKAEYGISPMQYRKFVEESEQD